MFIIIDSPPDLQAADDSLKVQRRWELEGIREGPFFWNHDHCSFDFGGGEYRSEEDLCSLLGEACRGLGEELVKNHVRSFEIRPVFAVRK